MIRSFFALSLSLALAGCMVWMPVEYRAGGIAIQEYPGGTVAFAASAAKTEAGLREADSRGVRTFAVIVGDSAASLNKLPMTPTQTTAINRDGLNYTVYLYKNPGGRQFDVRLYVKDGIIEMIEGKDLSS